MHRPRLLTFLALFAVALATAVVTACGGSDDDSGTLSKSAFAKRANDRCSKAKADRHAQLQQLPPSPAGAAEALNIQSAATVDRELILAPRLEHLVDLVLLGFRRHEGVDARDALRRRRR
jgi:hypothetical protein